MDDLKARRHLFLRKMKEEDLLVRNLGLKNIDLPEQFGSTNKVKDVPSPQIDVIEKYAGYFSFDRGLSSEDTHDLAQAVAETGTESTRSVSKRAAAKGQQQKGSSKRAAAKGQQQR